MKYFYAVHSVPTEKFVSNIWDKTGEKLHYRGITSGGVDASELEPLAFELGSPAASAQCFSLTHAMLPVVTKGLWEELAPLVENDVAPIRGVVSSTGEPLVVLNFLNEVDVMDYQRSRYQSFPKDFGIKDLAGKPSMIFDLVLSLDAMKGHSMIWFRTFVIVSEEVVEVLTRYGFTKFVPIDASGPDVAEKANL